jgi:S-adenosylmethionine:tRNA ribosyltransferase-isomerase
VEVRGPGLERIARPPIGMAIELGREARLVLVDGYRGGARLAQAELVAPTGWIDTHAAPIRYGACPGRWPLEAYQTVFARERGSAEMPSAGRPFSHAIVAALAARGVLVMPLTLHAGVSSLERDEQPFPERFRVPARTAVAVNDARGRGGRIVAVGTTAVRALESAARPDGVVEARGGWTDVVITPQRGLRVVDGLITGWHEPESSHLWMLEAAAGATLLERSYARAAELGLRGHEFGDSHLILA